ncbi:MAG: hypothetical protein AAB250_07725, partial [Bdellovibrionota bacterium]
MAEVGGWSFTASTAYSEQLGSNRHAPPSRFVAVVRYTAIRRSRRVLNPSLELFPTLIHHDRETGIVELLIKIAFRFSEDEVDVDGELAVSGESAAK